MERPKFNIGDRVRFTLDDRTYEPTIVLDRYWGDNPDNKQISGHRDCQWYYVYSIPEISKDPVISIESGDFMHTFKLELVERLNLVSTNYIKKVVL
jgi:hypothetical protein